MKTSEILIEARKLIEKPENWTQGAYARDTNKEQVSAYSDSAVCFCSTGALRLVRKNKTFEAGSYFYLENAMGCLNIPSFNDSHTHTEVLAKFDEAILKAQEDEKQ